MSLAQPLIIIAFVLRVSTAAAADCSPAAKSTASFAVDWNGPEGQPGCEAAPEPGASELACTVIDCASSFGPLAGCTCRVGL
jgi:hypothetical protein